MLKKIGNNLIGFIFADMPFVAWVIMMVCFGYGSIKLLDYEYITYLGYDLREIIFYYIAVAGIWMVISRYKSSLIAAAYIAIISKLNMEFFAVSNIADESFLMFICTALTLMYSVILNSICDYLIKKFNLEYFYTIDDLLDDDLFDDEEDEDVIFLSKAIRNEYSYKMSYAITARKILKELSMDITQDHSDDENVRWNERIEQLAANIDDGAKQGLDEYVKTYFWAAYYCGNKYGELFAKEKANTYMQRLIWNGKFSVAEFNQLFEEGTRELEKEEKCDLFLEINQLMSSMLKVSNVMENAKIVR